MLNNRNIKKVKLNKSLNYKIFKSFKIIKSHESIYKLKPSTSMKKTIFCFSFMIILFK